MHHTSYAPPSPQPANPRQCAPCEPGTFSNTLNATACLQKQPCLAGSRVVFEGDVMQDRLCTACDGVTEYQDEPNADSCKVITLCRDVEGETRPPSAIADRTCSRCASDAYLTNGGVCLRVSTCQPGEAELRTPTPTSDRVCTPCVADVSFSTRENAERCQVQPLCPPGTYVSTAATVTSARTCTACPPSSVASNVNSAACKPFGSCAVTQQSVRAPAPAYDRACASLQLLVRWGAANSVSRPVTTRCRSLDLFFGRPATLTTDAACRVC